MGIQVTSRGRLKRNRYNTVQFDVPTTVPAGNFTLAKIDFTGIKFLQAVGLDTTSADAEVTLTGTAVGDRVIAAIGLPTANTGVHTPLIATIGTHFEAAITVANKIVQKQAAGDLTANTYLFILLPATA